MNVNFIPMLRNYLNPENSLRFILAKRTLRIFSILFFSCIFSCAVLAFPNHLETITITSAPSGYSGCPGDTSAIAGILVNTDCGAFYEIEWSSAQDVSLNHLWPTNTLSPSFEVQKDTVIYKLKVIENCTQTADSVEIMIMPEVVAVAGINTGICVNETIQIGTPTVTGVTYSWAPTSGLNNPNLSNPTVSFPGNFALPFIKYDLTADDGMGCVAQDSVEISFYQLPEPDFSADTICVGTATTFTNLTPNMGNIVSYNWAFGQGIASSTDINPTFTYGAAGVYSVSLTTETSNGCTETFTKDIFVASDPVISGVIMADPTDCNAGDGRIIITAMATQIVPPGIEYSIDGGTTWQFSSVFNGLNAGNYDLQVRNGNACMTTGGTATLEEPASPSIDNVNKSDPTDCSAADGDIEITASGGVAPLQYSIDGVTWTSANEIGNLSQGSYPILVRNADGSCVVNGGLIMLVEPTAPIITEVRFENPSECGFGDGNIRIVASGGSGTLEYSINNGATWVTTDSFPDLIAGVFEVRVRNGDGTCITTAGATELMDPPSPMENDKLLTNPSECGASDGRIDIDATAGIGATQFSIDGGATWTTSNLFINLSEGVYDVFLRNGDSTCVVDAGTAVLEEPNAPELGTVDSNNPSDCNMSDGDITIVATGGNGSIVYSIDAGITWETSNVFEDLGAGNYDLMMRNFDGTCMVDIQDVTLTAPEGPTDPTFSFSYPNTCNGNEGSILVSLTPTMGQTYQYSIDGGMNWAGNGFFLGLIAGDYDVMVRNIDGTCETAVGTAELVGPPSVFINDVTTNGMNACLSNSGEITISASYSGVQPLDFSVDGGMNWSLSPTFSNLPQGTYNIVVRVFDLTCMVTGPEVVLQSPNPPAINNVLVTDISNCGLSDGAIFVIDSDPNPFEVSIDSGMTYTATTFFSNLVAGTYYVWARNVDGTCEGEIGAYTITEPSEPIISNINLIQPTACDAADGGIELTITGSSFTQTSIDGGFTWQGLSNYTNLSDGDYMVMVRNADGTCVSAIQEVSLRNTANALDIDVLATGTNCGQSNGMISITATGNTGSLEYSIDGGSVWSVSGLFSNLDFGNYNIAVRDNGTCLTTAGVATIIEVDAPILDSINQVNPSVCGINDGTITIFASGSTGTYEYSIDNGISWQTGNTFTALSAGLYQPMVRPTIGGCEVGSTTVTLLVTDAPTITNLTTQNGICGPNGFIEILANSTSGTLEYSIDNGGTWGSNNTFSNLSAGNYFVRVRDSVSLCEGFGGGIILNETSAPEIANVAGTNPDCSVANGIITVTLTTTLPGMTQYSIDDGVTWQIDNSFTNLGAGTYLVKARNTMTGVWCESTSVQYELTQPTVPMLSLSTTDPTDCGVMDGSITINATGGTGTLEYSIDSMNWQASNLISNLAAGMYTTYVRYTDGSCALAGPSITLNAPAEPTISNVDSTNPDCGGAGGSITITASGTGNLEYSITDPPIWVPMNVFNNVVAGTYQIRVRNANGSCPVDGGMLTLIAPGTPVFERVDVVQPTCTTADGSLTITANLGTDPATLLEYSIDGGATWQASNVFSNLSEGNYDIRLRRTDDPNCTTNAGGTQLSGGDSPEILLVQTTNITDCDFTNGQLEIFANGRGGLPDNDIEYSIDGVTFTRSAIFSNLAAGTYTPYIRFLDGTCLSTGTPATLTSPSAPERTSLVFNDPSCDGSDGSITATTTGSSTVEYSIDGGNTWSGIGNFINLTAGSYTVAYRYTNGTCPVIDTTLNLVADGGFAVTGMSMTPATACDDMDGAVTVTATGTGTLEFSLDGMNWQASNTFSNLAPGRYELRIRYTDGTCEAVASVFDIDATRSVTLNNVSSSNVTSCANSDGRIEITATSTEILEYSLDGLTYQSSPIFDNLNGGVYTPSVRIVGFNCTVTGNAVTIDAPTQLSVASVTVTHPLDCGVDGGMIQVQMAPGNGSVEYSIDGGVTYVGTNFFQSLAAGSYNVFIRKFDGSCITPYANNPVMIVSPDLPTAMISNSVQPDCDMANGSITVTGMPTSNPNNLPLEYSLDGITYQSSNTFSNLAEGFYSIHVRLENSSCKTQVDINITEPAICLTCDVIRTDTIQINQVDLMNPMCIPMNLMAANEFNLSLDGLTVMNEGGCMPDSSYFYGYVPLVTLGGSDGPFDLVSWEFNGNTFSGSYPTLNDLAAALNTWDPSNNWINDPAAFAFGGGSSGNIYGDMVVRHVRTNRTVSLQVNSFAIFAGTQITVTGIGWHSFIAVDPITGCADTLDIEIIGTPDVPEVRDIYLTTPMNTNLQFCDWNSFFTNPFDNPTLCSNATNGTSTATTCTDYDPNTDFVGYDEYCLVSCRMSNGMTICDTAFIHIRVLPPPDRFSINMETNMPFDTCINNLLQLGITSYVVSDCGGGSDVTFSAQAGNEGCLTLTPAAGFNGNTSVCVVHCDNIPNPEGPICDTTIIDIVVSAPCMDDIVMEDTIRVEGYNGVSSVCVPISLLDISNYDLSIDGQPYGGSFSGCNQDSTWSYLYFSIPGAGVDGPYNITWEINGMTESSTVQDLDALVDSMNVWDPAGEWEVVTQIFSIVGKRNGYPAGTLTATSLNSGLMASLDPSRGSSLGGSAMVIDDGAGTRVLTILDTRNGCTDEVIILVNDNQITTDTIRLTTSVNVPILNECLPENELAMAAMSLNSCGDPMNGTVDLMNVPCFDYTPNNGFVGNDTMCLVLCDFSFPNVCDTTIIIIQMTDMQTCDLFSDVSLTRELDVCAVDGAVCLPVDPAELPNYTLFIDRAEYLGPTAGCDNDTIYLYNLNLLAGTTAGTLDNWMVNGNSFSTNFSSFQEIVDSMNVWDPAGNWMFNTNMTITGGMPSSDYGGFDLTVSGSNVQVPRESRFTPNGVSIVVAPGNREVVAMDGSGCTDTLQLNVVCPNIPDVVTDTTMMVGDVYTVCLSDLNLPIDESFITSIMNNCTPNGNVDFNFMMANNCLEITGLSEGMDTTCFEICLIDGTCFNWNIYVEVNDGCDNFITPDNSVIGVNCDADSLFVCVRGFMDINSADFNLEIDGMPYTQTLEVCGFDSTFSYSYNSLPGVGNAGPYEITSWFINGVEYTGMFDDIPSLVDSFNVWDPTGNWRQVTSGVSITGGNPRNTYGTIFVEQVATGNPATMSPNVLIVGTGLGFYMQNVGNSTLTFLRIADGCRDTIEITTTCIGTTIIRDTIDIGDFNTDCLPTTELVGNFTEIFNFCSNDSGTAVMVDWSPMDTCITYEGLEPGTEQACFIVCDDLGVCDTTYYIITVLDPNDSIPVMANPDTLITNIDTRMVINALGNDIFNPGTDTMFITIPPMFGTAMFLPDGTLEYIPDPGYCNNNDSTDYLEYAICDNNTCDTAGVTIIVNCVSDTLFVNNGFSPNGDGINDVFVIEGVFNYPESNLKIYNRWGNRIFEENGYRNTWTGDWEGVELPDGTYYYIFDTGDGNLISGYLQIQR